MAEEKSLADFMKDSAMTPTAESVLNALRLKNYEVNPPIPTRAEDKDLAPSKAPP